MILKKIALIVFLVVHAQYVCSQTGFLYQKRAFSGGIGTNFIMGSKDSEDKSLLLPKVNFGYHFCGKHDLFIEASYHMLPNSTDMSQYTNKEDISIWTTNTHYTKMRSDNFSLTMAGRLFTRLGPVGFYWHFGTTLNLTYSEILDQHIYREHTTYNDYELVTEEVSSGKATTWITSIPFGFGKVYALNDRMAFDIGIRASANLLFDSGSGDSFLNEANRKSAISKAISSTSLIGIYANIQLFH